MTAPLSDEMIESGMARAIEAARAAALEGEVPVGAVVLGPAGEELAVAGNRPIGDTDPTAHAEIRALRAASLALKNYRLPGCTLVVTLEPCAMCAGAIVHARIAHLVFGADDPKGGAIRHGPKLFDQPTVHHRPSVTSGVRAEECGRLLKEFFAARRAK